MSTVLVLVLCVTTADIGPKAPAAPYEHLLTRAKTVACEKAAAAMSESVTGGIASIIVLPLENDPGHCTRRLFLNAATRAGLTMLVGDDLAGGSDSICSLGRSAKVDAVVFGSVSEVGLLHGRGHVRLTLTMADAQTAAVVWGTSVTGTSDEIWPAPEPGQGVGHRLRDTPVCDAPSGPFRQSVPDPLTLAVWGLLAALVVLLVLILAAMIGRARGRARRERLARRLIAVSTAPATPVRGLLDRARGALRRAQMALAERGHVNQAARILDERVRLERLLRLAHHGGGDLDAALLFGAPPAPAESGRAPAEVLAMDVARHALRIEAAADQDPANLQQSLPPLRQACRRLASALNRHDL